MHWYARVFFLSFLGVLPTVFLQHLVCNPLTKLYYTTLGISIFQHKFTTYSNHDKYILQ